MGNLADFSITIAVHSFSRTTLPLTRARIMFALNNTTQALKAQRHGNVW